jgi:hypothetical protein
MRSGIRLATLPASLALLLVMVLISGCGTHGNAPALGKPGQASLTPSGSSQSQATVVLTPFHALHVTVYFRGKQVPTTGAQTPAQIRENDCVGPFLAPITDGNLPTGTSTLGTSSQSSLVDYAPDPAGGMDVAAVPSAKLFVIVLNHRDDPSAEILACGDPLSGQNQYFNLNPPSVGNAGVALGTALMSPIAAVRLTFTVHEDALQPVAWAVRENSCTGALVASGPLDAKTTPLEGVVYRGQDSNRWWVVLTGGNGQVLCGQVKV